MKFELFKPKENKIEIPKEYQEAFKSMANELIFNEPFNEMITKENAGQVSKKIQEEYLRLFTKKSIDLHKKLMQTFKFDIQVLGAPSEWDNPDNNPNIEKLNETIRKQNAPDWEPEYKYEDDLKEDLMLPEKDFIEKYSGMMVAHDGEYDGWSFTPKLANNLETKYSKISRNCFGTASIIGSYCKLRGLKVEMAITPDHPLILASLNDGIYPIEGIQKGKIDGKEIEDKGPYKIYRPGENKKTKWKMAIVQDFDKALIYEILENMEVLRRISLGDKNITLPERYEDGMKLANEHKEVLQKINWKDLQIKLFPEIVSSFQENGAEWSQEVSRMKALREEQHLDSILLDILRKSKNSTSWSKEDFEKAQDLIIEESQKYKVEIIEFLKNDKKLNSSIPDDIKNFFTTLKNEAVQNKEPKIKEYVYSVIESRLLDTNQ